MSVVMEPISPGPNLPIEKVGLPNGSFEGATQPQVSSVEKKGEKIDSKESIVQSPGQSTGVPIPILPPPATDVSVKPGTTPHPTVQDDSPLAANDDDVMEREWVQKAKKIVLQTRSDPYMQEKQVSRLQADYVKKRYGKELKVSD